MAKQSFLFTQLDERTRQYLADVRASAGEGKAGIYLSGGKAHAAWAFPLTGLVILSIVLCLVVPPLNDPTHQAMLLTAGLLLGGWFVVAGLRIGVALARGRTAGPFTYADPRGLWVVDYSTVERWPVNNLRSVGIVEGALALSLEYPEGIETVNIPFETGILEIAVYLDYWIQARGGGKIDQDLIDTHAVRARAVAYDQLPETQPQLSTDIPIPQPDKNYRRWDWPVLLAIVVFSVALFFVVFWFVRVWHDYSVYQFVRNQSPTHWRAYLLDERHTMYREEVKQMLHDRYRQKADSLKQQIAAQNEAPFKGSDEAMAQLVLALADAPTPVVTLRVQDTTDENAKQKFIQAFPFFNNLPLQNVAQTEISEGLYDALGQDHISMAQPIAADIPPLLEVRYYLVKDDKASLIEWHLAVRKDPDSEPLFKANWSTKIENSVDTTFRNELRRIKIALSGTRQAQPPPQPPRQPGQFP